MNVSRQRRIMSTWSPTLVENGQMIGPKGFDCFGMILDARGVGTDFGLRENDSTLVIALPWSAYRCSRVNPLSL